MLRNAIYWLFSLHHPDFHDFEDEHKSVFGLLIPDAMYIVLVDPPYNIVFNCANDDWDYYTLARDDGKVMMSLGHEMPNLDYHDYIFCSALEYGIWLRT